MGGIDGGGESDSEGDEGDDEEGKERKMRERVTDGALMDVNLLCKLSPGLGSKLEASFALLCSVTLFLRPLFSPPLHHGSHFTLGVEGRYLEQNRVGKGSRPLSVPDSFLSFPISWPCHCP